MNLFELTRTLIDIPSVTGEEGEVGQFLAAHLRGLGYRVETQEVERDRWNVIATTESPPRIMLSTHIDTVPSHLVSEEDDDSIIGRGACDAKGILAAQIFAAERLRRDGNSAIGLLFTVDEEMASLGARAANAHPLASDCRYLINGEPTDSRLAVGTKGSLRVTVATTGVAAHSAYPEQGESAIEKLIAVLENIRHCNWPNDPLFGDTTCNIGVIAGGTRPNVIAASAHADMQLRLATSTTRVKQILEQTIAGRARVEYLSGHDPVRLLAVEGFEKCLVRFTTDIPYLSSWGQPLLLGPGSILDAHTDHERISKNELTQAVDLYARLVNVLCDKSEKVETLGVRC